MDRPPRDSRQHNGITRRGLSQPTSATKSELSGRRRYGERGLLSERERNVSSDTNGVVGELIRSFFFFSVVCNCRLFTLSLCVSLTGGIGRWPTDSATSHWRMSAFGPRQREF